MMGEEGDHFIEIIDRIHATWQAMPKTYETLNPPKSEADTGRADLDFSAGRPRRRAKPPKKPVRIARIPKRYPLLPGFTTSSAVATGGSWRRTPTPTTRARSRPSESPTLGMGAELGYISIPELLENGAELDLYYTEPKTIGEILS